MYSVKIKIGKVVFIYIVFILYKGLRKEGCNYDFLKFYYKKFVIKMLNENGSVESK